MSVLVNGDRRRVLPFETFDRLFSTTRRGGHRAVPAFQLDPVVVSGT
jgi:hypothetical protein